MDDNGQILYKVLSGLGGNDPDLQNNEGDSATPLSQLCRICALPNEYLIPIFEGEGQENNLADKIHSHLPIRVSTIDDYPDQVCYQCASTLLAFHDLVDCCKQANITLTSRVQLGQSKKTFTKISTQAKNIDASQTNKERYSLSFRSIHRAQRGLKVPSSPLAADVKLEPDSNVERHSASAFQNHANYFMDDSLFPPQGFTYSNLDDVDDDDPISNSIPAEIEEKSDWGLFRKQYISLQSAVAKLQEHVARCHKYSSKFSKVKKRTPRIYDTLTTQELEKVKVIIDGKVQYQCTICDRYFPRTNRYLIHKSVHSAKLYPCEICGRKFRVHGYLKNHMRKIHSLKNNQDLVEYQRLHPVSESLGNKNVEVKTGRKYFDYKAIDKVKVIINGEVFYQCKICDMKLSRVSYYLNHISVHTGEKRFVCHLCGRRFRLNTMLRVHLRVTHENIKNFGCDICQQKFGTKNNLIEHRRIHSGERPHICSKCGKRFKQKSALYIHNRTHTDYFPFKCVQCDSKFRIQSQLNYHMIKHTGEKPYSCEVCGKAFPLKCHLNHHMRIHTEVRPYPCTLCGKAFRHTSNLKVHLKNCHKMNIY